MENKKPVYSVIIAGSRTFDDYELLKEKCLYYLKGKMETHIVGIFSGAAKGADELGLKFAKEMGLQYMVFPANWEKDGKSAGFIRNQTMAGFADALIAFWDGKSVGTEHMIGIMNKMKKPCRIIYFTPKA